jgi:hypothetical protein
MEIEAKDVNFPIGTLYLETASRKQKYLVSYQFRHGNYRRQSYSRYTSLPKSPCEYLKDTTP